MSTTTPNNADRKSAPTGPTAPRSRRRWQRVLTHAALMVLSVIFVIPFVWLLSTSLKPESLIFRYPPAWVPRVPETVKVDDKETPLYTMRGQPDLRVAVVARKQDVALGREVIGDRATDRQVVVSMSKLEPIEHVRVQWSNYVEGLTFVPYFRYLFNTGIIAALNVLGAVLSCSLVAYGLARIHWPGRDVLFIVLLSTMMLPGQVTMVPLFVIFKHLHWIDTWMPLFVPAFLGNAFLVFLLRQFFLTIPTSLTDAARLDGCSEFDIYRRIIIPLSKPALATVGLFAFMNAWNDYLGPLIYLFNDQKYTLSLGLANFLSQYGSYWGPLMAASTVMTVPIIILFFFTQRTFIQGISLTGIKG